MWQETFQLDRLYDEVRTEVDTMHDYLLTLYNEEAERLQREQQLHAEAQAREAAQRERAAEERARRLERRLSALALFIGIPALIIGFLGINLAGITYNSIPLWEALVVVGAGTLIFASLALLAVARDWRTRAEKHEGRQ
jgi:predicted nucleic acid-binding protein